MCGGLRTGCRVSSFSPVCTVSINLKSSVRLGNNCPYPLSHVASKNHVLKTAFDPPSLPLKQSFLQHFLYPLGALSSCCRLNPKQWSPTPQYTQPISTCSHLSLQKLLLAPFIYYLALLSHCIPRPVNLLSILSPAGVNILHQLCQFSD